MKKIRPIKNTWYDWLSVGGFTDKVFLDKTNTPKQKVYWTGKKLNKSEEEETYYKPKSESNFITMIILNIKEVLTEIKVYHQKILAQN